MLYVTTRNDKDAFTINHALNKNRGADGGLYVPFQIPCFTPEALAELKDQTFNQRMASVLNLLFGCKLNGWDLDFAIGRHPVRLSPMIHRIVIGESWHNPDWRFDRMAADLLQLIQKQSGDLPCSDWAGIGVRIAVIFGIFGEFMRSGILGDGSNVDVAVASGDLSGAMACWYARKMGLPIANIVIVCNENASLWDLIRRGELRTGQVAVTTTTPVCDQILPASLERLIYACGGTGEVQEYLAASRRGGLYCPADSTLQAMQKGIHVSVVGTRRMASTIPNVYGNSKRILDPYAALVYCGLQDYRAAAGESRPALILSERSPVCDADTVAAAMGIPKEQLMLLLNQK